MREETGRFLARAARSIEAAAMLLAAEFDDEAASRAYYAMFYTAPALLSAEGVRFRKHSGVHSAFGRTCARDGLLDPKYHRWLLDAFALRIDMDYGDRAAIDARAATEKIAQAREFLDAARVYLNEKGAPHDEA